MTRTTYPATWPGTCVIRSVHTPFNWQTTDHARMSCVIASDTALRTPVYNQWLAARMASPDSTPDWPEWRQRFESKQKAPTSNRRVGGFGVHEGTIVGLSSKADKLLAARPGAKAVMSKAHALPTPKPMHLTRAPAQAGNPRHNGAYSRAGITGGDAKIHKPAKARKVAA